MFSTQWRNKITLRKKNLGIYLNCIIKMTMYFWNICLYFGGRNKSIHFKSTVRISVKSPPCALQTIPLWVYTDKGVERNSTQLYSDGLLLLGHTSAQRVCRGTRAKEGVLCFPLLPLWAHTSEDKGFSTSPCWSWQGHRPLPLQS